MKRGRNGSVRCRDGSAASSSVLSGRADGRWGRGWRRGGICDRDVEIYLDVGLILTSKGPNHFGLGHRTVVAIDEWLWRALQLRIYNGGHLRIRLESLNRNIDPTTDVLGELNFFGRLFLCFGLLVKCGEERINL